MFGVWASTQSFFPLEYLKQEASLRRSSSVNHWIMHIKFENFWIICGTFQSIFGVMINSKENATPSSFFTIPWRKNKKMNEALLGLHNTLRVWVTIWHSECKTIFWTQMLQAWLPLWQIYHQHGWDWHYLGKYCKNGYFGIIIHRQFW